LAKILEDHPEYAKQQEIKKQATEKIKAILLSIGEAYPKLAAEIQNLTDEQKAEKELITDLALNKFMAGEKVEVVDEDGRVFEPVWSVRFVKTDREKKSETEN
jgi:molecular chaperone GrpE (heat shock protein)